MRCPQIKLKTKLSFVVMSQLPFFQNIFLDTRTQTFVPFFFPIPFRTNNNYSSPIAKSSKLSATADFCPFFLQWNSLSQSLLYQSLLYRLCFIKTADFYTSWNLYSQEDCTVVMKWGAVVW